MLFATEGLVPAIYVKPGNLVFGHIQVEPMIQHKYHIWTCILTPPSIVQKDLNRYTGRL